MTIDINAPEVQEAIKAAVEEATNKLAAHNSKLLGELKAARKGQDADPAEMQALRDRLDEVEGKLSAAEKLAKAAQGDAEKYRKQAEAESSYTNKLLVDIGLNDALTKVGVKPEFLKAAKAMFGNQVQLKTEGDNRIPVVGEKALSDFAAEWAKSDEGKHFVAAPQNGGGGAQGGSGNPAAQKGNLLGTKSERVAAIEARFPALKTLEQ